MRRAGGICVRALTAAALAVAACDDEPDFTAPGLGDFVQFTQPADGEALSLEAFQRRPRITIALNFIPAEGAFGYGGLQSFRYDGREVAGAVQVILGGGFPPQSASLSFVPEVAEPGEHVVELEYADSREVLHRIRWRFTVQG